MDSFFGIGAPELILILVIAGIVMGPERIGRTARWLGRTSSQLQNISRAFIRQLNAEIDGDGESNEIRAAWSDMQDMRRQIEELKSELMSVTKSALNEGNRSLSGIKQEVEQTIAPPAMLKKVQDSDKSDADAANHANSAALETPFIPDQLPNRVTVPDDPEQ
ncbi:MAG: twin-arginine translocase TatA/TatE family subunit [Candidatus Promineifilaceae bacterium]|nr:twin-arginine translocase TatA/TatE family subunit [Candidatus Promineifilaceae bacterium]